MTRDEAIASITGRLVEYYQPERIYLFGSEARGEAGPDSDLDFCVVVPVSSVNYFSSSTTIISPYQRQLLFNA